MQGNILDRYVYLENNISTHTLFFKSNHLQSVGFPAYWKYRDPEANQRIEGHYPQAEYDLNIGIW